MDTIPTKSEYDGVTTPAPSTEVHTADELNDRIVELQGAVTDSGQSLAAADAGQLSKASFANAVGAQSMQDNGSANTIRLTPITGANGLRVATPATPDYSLLVAAIFNFKAAATNTGNTTVNVGQNTGAYIGAVSLFLDDGTSQISAGGIVAGNYYNVRYTSAGGGAFILLGGGHKYVKLVDSKAATTDGGSSTASVWQKRTVTEDTDTGNNVTVTSSVIVLSAGTYECRISAPAYRSAGHAIRLRNTTGSVTVLIGTSEYNVTTDAAQNRSEIVGRFSIAAAQNLEIQHYMEASKSTDGLGKTNADAVEPSIYTVAEFWKL